MKLTSVIVAATATTFTLFFSVKPVPPVYAQAQVIPPVINSRVTDSLEQVLAEKSKSTLQKAEELVDRSKDINRQAHKIAERKRPVIVKKVEVPVPVCCDSLTTVYQQEPTPRRPFLWRIFHKSR